MSEGGASRRALLRATGTALAGAGAAALTGCGSTATGRKAVKQMPPAIMRADVEILLQALELERRAATAYVACIPLLPHSQAKAARQFLNEELEHTGELISLIKAAGGKSPPRADSYDIGRASDAASGLAVLHTLEALQIRSYLRWIPKLSPGPVRAAVSSILTVDSQHLALVRVAQGRAPVPGPFVTGSV